MADLDRIAAVHAAAFPNSLLASLGPVVVRRYYQWQLRGPHEALALGVEHDGELAGFCLAGVFRGALTGFLKENRFCLIVNVLLRPWLVFGRRNRRRVMAGAQIVFPIITGYAQPCLPRWPEQKTFGILALAIDPKHSRAGCGRLLMDACETIALDRQFSRLLLTVDPTNEAAINFYLTLGWAKLVVNGRWNNTMFKALPAASNGLSSN
jgi:ribosomal protein S18 acetylase RimI-like enzyme